MIDTFLRLSGTMGTPGTPQDIDPAASATPLWSEFYLDQRGDNGFDIGAGTNIYALFTVNTEDFDSATKTATCEFQIITSPKTSLATFTFTAATTDIITAAAHGLTEGTRVTVASSTTLPAGLAAATNYFVRDVTTNTFKLSATPLGTAVDITDTGTGTHTLTWYPEVVASSGPQPVQRLLTGVQIPVRINPWMTGKGFPKNNYVFARYVVSSDLTAGMAFCDLVHGTPASHSHTYDPGTTITVS